MAEQPLQAGLVREGGGGSFWAELGGMSKSTQNKQGALSCRGNKVDKTQKWKGACLFMGKQIDQMGCGRRSMQRKE